MLVEHSHAMTEDEFATLPTTVEKDQQDVKF
jgi:hypothetical protein